MPALSEKVAQGPAPPVTWSGAWRMCFSNRSTPTLHPRPWSRDAGLLPWDVPHDPVRGPAGLYRVIKGPVIIDRIVGVHVIGTKTIAVVLLTGHLFDRVEFFIDIALVYALINFIGTLALSKYFERKGAEHRSAPP